MENANSLSINLDKKSNDGLTAFHIACVKGHSGVIKACLDNAANVRSIDLNMKNRDGMTGFHIACQKGHTNVIKIFLENSANLSIDLNTKDDDGMTGFHNACLKGHSDVVKIFLEKARDMNIDLTIKTKISNRVPIAELLLDNEAHVAVDYKVDPMTLDMVTILQPLPL